jgi:urea transport system permease protein
VVWVAVGGRGFLVGGPLGAVLVNAAKTVFTGSFADFWLFFLGGLFIAVTLFLPRGVFGLLQDGLARVRGRGAGVRGSGREEDAP